MPADPTLKQLAERVEVELRQQVSDDVGAGFDVEPPPGVGRRADFEALDAEVQAGGIIIAGVHYRREEVEAGRRLLRELGQSERSLRSVLEFVRGNASDLRPPPRRRSERPARPPELGKLSQMYPEEAERLRIPGSLEAIDNRLRAAIGFTAPWSG